MSWKRQLQLLDFETDDRLEARCCKCGFTWYEQPVVHLNKSHLRMLYVDEFENKLRCKQWNCSGNIKLAQSHNEETEGFQGGLA